MRPCNSLVNGLKNHLTESCVMHNGDIFIKASPQLKLFFPHTGANNKRRLKKKKKKVWVKLKTRVPKHEKKMLSMSLSRWFEVHYYKHKNTPNGVRV